MPNMLENQKEGGKPKERSESVNTWLIRGIAILLLFAAGMKTWQLATVPVLGEGLLHARWFNILVVEFELVFAIWLIFGLLPQLTRWATIGLFTTFAAVSLYKALSGESSCGCFGQAQVNPWWTCTLDVMLVVLLVSTKKTVTTDKPDINPVFARRQLLIMILLWFTMAVPATYAMTNMKKSDFSDLGTVFVGVDGKETILVEPEKWTKGEFPLLPYIEPPEVREKLKTGIWTIVLYHHDCSKCQQVIKDLAAKGEPNVVCVEVPPWINEYELSNNCVSAKLTDKMTWFIETPCIYVGKTKL